MIKLFKVGLVVLIFIQSAFAITSVEEYLDEQHKKSNTTNNGYEMSPDGILYEPSTKKLFKTINYRFMVGSLKKNLVTLAERHDWRIDWNLDTDYVIPREFVVLNKTVPQIFSDATAHLPIKTMFYSKNRMITIMPMYDKKESDFSDEYSVDIRK